jgi:superfamily II DNA or RNA helicase
LVADFDGSAAMLDALAYVKAARSRQVPAALEISQSGQGAHVWVFFVGPIPAVIARAVGTVLIHEAMTLRGAMDLSSYDRLFPSQDVLPDAGFGNLIALPLQGRRRRDGLTTFLDLSTLEPYEDQWALLSTMDRLSRSAAIKIAKQTDNATVGSTVHGLSRATASTVHPRLPTVLHAELDAGLKLEATHLTPAAMSTFKHAASMVNPKFYELQRLRKSTWDTPRFVRGYDLTIEGDLVLPRGLRHLASKIVRDAGSRLDITDLRSAGTEIDLAFSGQLDSRQTAAVDALLGHDDGVLVAPPGSGKTVLACAVIAERAASTLILLDRKALAEQWRAQIEKFLGFRPGQLGGGRRKLTGVIDIIMLPSLARRADVTELTQGYGHVVVDECHHLAAAAYDHSVKRIRGRYWLGLTATPERRDRLGELVTWQLGPIRHTMNEDAAPTLPDAFTQEPGQRRVLHVHPTSFRCDDVDLALPGALAEVHRTLAADPARNAQIVDDVVSAASRGRNCLVLTRRVAHVEAIVEILAGRGHHAMILQGGMNATQRREAVQRLSEANSGDGVLVVGTTPFIGEGFDAPALDTLFLAAPVSFDGLLVQCAGRVVRTSPGKERVEVNDYHDQKVPILAASLKRRMPGYRKLGFTESPRVQRRG